MRYPAKWPARPGANTTIVLFATHDRLAGGAGANFPGMSGIGTQLPTHEIDAIEVVFLRHDQASAANGLRLYARDDEGNFREVDLKGDDGVATIGAGAPKQVPLLAAGAEARYLIDVGRYSNGWALEYTSGAIALGASGWNGVLSLLGNESSVGR